MISKQHQQWCEKNEIVIGVSGAAKYLGISFGRTLSIINNPSLGFPTPIEISGRSNLYFCKKSLADFSEKIDVKKIKITKAYKNYIGIRNDKTSGLDVKMALRFMGVNVSKLENYESARCE